MTTVYFIRHGTTENNIAGRFQGRSDIPLGEKGRKQAACLGERFAHIPLDAVYTSPLRRAYQTAEGVCAHLPVQPICCDGLREIDGGALEGRTNDENIRDYPDVMRNFREHPAKFNPRTARARSRCMRVCWVRLKKLSAKNETKPLRLCRMASRCCAALAAWAFRSMRFRRRFWQMLP